MSTTTELSTRYTEFTIRYPDAVPKCIRKCTGPLPEAIYALIEGQNIVCPIGIHIKWNDDYSNNEKVYFVLPFMQFVN